MRVDISDTGVGIAPEHQSRVFDPFFTTKEKGTGLGLSVVYGIIERHHGHVALHSQPGQGTCLTFTLPRGEAPPASLAPRAASPQESQR